MPPYYRLKGFESKLAPSGDYRILISGSRHYDRILRLTFPEYRLSTIFPDSRKVYDWGVFVKHINEQQRHELEQLLELCKNTICIEDALEQSFALDTQYQDGLNGRERTTIGQLVYLAKYKNDKPKAVELADHLANFMLTHPAYRKSDYLMSVPPSDPNKNFSLSNFLVEQLSAKLALSKGTSFVRKTRKTKPMKDCETVSEKHQNIDGAFEVVPSAPLNGCVVTIIDDLYQSGETVNQLASVLKMAGARVQALIAVKTWGLVNRKVV